MNKSINSLFKKSALAAAFAFFSIVASAQTVYTGTISETVTLPDGANITLNNATITGGIVCEGSATITLVGTNSVTGINYQSAGIQIGGSGTTLTIKGDGSLSATGGNQSAGIGLSRIWNYDSNVSSGDIVIEGGTITAIGGNQGAGIGTGIIKNTNNDNSTSVQFGNVTIKGGTVTATDGGSGDGIGKGYSYPGPSITFGIVTIYDGINMVDASSIKNSESIVYMHDETDVTASASNYFTITEDGNRRIIVPKDDTDYTITIADDIEHGTLTVAATAKYMEKVTITATPDLGYRLSRLVVKDADNNDVATTGNSFFMPKSSVTVSAVFEERTHGTTEFAWGYFRPTGFVREASIYDGLTTVNLQQGQSYQILKYDEYDDYRKFFLDNDTYDATIPYSGGTGTFPEYGNGTNFSVDYNGESGFYDITMTDVGNGKWNVSIQKTAGQMDVVPDQTYTGSEITPEPLVLVGSLNFTKGTDYEYSYSNNTNVGTATVTVTFKGDYSSLGSVEKEFNIIRATPTVTLTLENVSDIAAQTYTGSAITPEITVTDGEKTLTLGTDYTVSYSDNTNAGTATAKITGKGNYSGEIEKTFVIGKATPVVTAPTANTLTYNGNEQELVTAGTTDFGTVLYSLDGTNYSADIPTATDAGTYTVYYKVDTDKYYYAPQMVEVVIETATSIEDAKADKSTNSNVWYDLNGRRLAGKPSARGIYINNGEKVLIK